MKDTTRKLVLWCGIGVALLCMVLTIIFAMNNGGVKELSAVKANGAFDATFWILVCLIAVSLIAILVFLVKKLASNFKEQPGYWKKFLGLVGAIVVVCLAAFLLSKGSDVSPALMEKHDVTEATSKLIGAACIIVYILVAAAAVAIVGSEIAKSLKK
jgi:drug/metabolite transporter (DMT)-like permease